ncbi:hypothetical protein LEMLEM_LOCUS7395 [Lemmus lemmus]
MQAKLASNLMHNLEILILRAGKMAQQLRALSAFSEDPGSIPSTHMSHRHSQLSIIPVAGDP